MPRARRIVPAGRCRNRRTSSSSAAATPGSTPPASWPGAASPSRLLEAETLGFGASTRNGGIVHPGYKWGPARAGPALRRGHRAGALPRDARRLRDGQAADRRRGDRLRLPRAAGTSSWPTPRRTSRTWSTRRRAWRRWASTSTIVPRERIREEIGSDAYFGALVVPDSGAAPPRPLLRRVSRRPPNGPAPTSTSGVRARAIRRQADGRLRRRDRTRRDPRPRRPRRHERLHRRRRPVAAPADHPDRQLHHRQRATPRGAGTRALAQGPGVLRHQELPVLLARLGRPADGLRRPGELPADHRSTRRPRSSIGACSRSTRSWPAIGSSTPGAATSASPSTGCRTSGGRRRASPTRWAAAGPASP